MLRVQLQGPIRLGSLMRHREKKGQASSWGRPIQQHGCSWARRLAARLAYLPSLLRLMLMCNPLWSVMVIVVSRRQPAAHVSTGESVSNIAVAKWSKAKLDSHQSLGSRNVRSSTHHLCAPLVRLCRLPCVESFETTTCITPIVRLILSRTLFSNAIVSMPGPAINSHAQTRRARFF